MGLFWILKKLQFGRAVLRWRRNRRGDHFLPPTFIERSFEHSKFHKTTSERWQRAPGTQKRNPFSLKGGRAKYER